MVVFLLFAFLGVKKNAPGWGRSVIGIYDGGADYWSAVKMTLRPVPAMRVK